MLPAYFMGLQSFKTDISKILKNKKLLNQEIKDIYKLDIKKINLILLNYVPELKNFCVPVPTIIC